MLQSNLSGYCNSQLTSSFHGLVRLKAIYLEIHSLTHSLDTCLLACMSRIGSDRDGQARVEKTLELRFRRKHSQSEKIPPRRVKIGAALRVLAMELGKMEKMKKKKRARNCLFIYYHKMGTTTTTKTMKTTTTTSSRLDLAAALNSSAKNFSFDIE